MKPANCLLVLIGIVIYIQSAISQPIVSVARESIPETQVTYLRSSIVGDEFKITVALPPGYDTTRSSFPVLYATDANLGFASLTQITRTMEQPGIEELPGILLVGIGYPVDSLWDRNRSRDLSPIDAANPYYQTGGAPLFLRFIKEELIPFIRNKYRVSSDAAYWGYSMGGLFGLYVLFHQPETFQRYIIGSPACLFYKVPPFLKYEAEYASKHRELSARVFMSFGALEETQGTVKIPNGIRDMQSLAELLRKRNYPGLKLETKIFEDETHLSGWPLTITRGLRSIYGK